jgi:hypothetical protein
VGDAAALGGVRSTVTWQRRRGVAVSTSPPQLGPNVGNGWGARRRRRWPRVVVVLVSGGGGERKDGMVTMCDAGDNSTAVARFGNTRAPIIN